MSESALLSNVTGEMVKEERSLWVGGLVAIIVFYLIVLMVGVYAGWKRRKEEQTQEQVMLAGRDIGLFVGVLTMGATWVGGGFINGSAQAAYEYGLIWTLAPFGYSISLIISGTFYARKMRESEYITMIDAFTQKYGNWGALLVFPAAISEILWSASILGALGSTLQVILALDENTSIIVSAVIAVLYTLLGGLISVAYTDVVQMFFIFFGLFLALPFAWLNENVGDIYAINPVTQVADWYGQVEPHKWGAWIDEVFLLLFGGIPWQVYFQRVLSSKTAARAQYLSYGGAAIALIMTGPSVLFGAVAKATDWEAAGFHEPVEPKTVLPLALQYLTPPAVAFFGLGAVSAAVMSSTDSSMLSASTIVARNVYKKVFRPHCSEKEVLYALYVLIVINCIIATVLAITYKSIYDLFVLCSDFMFVIVFPQLTFVLYLAWTNTYGFFVAFWVALLLRFLVGVETLGIPVNISFGTIYNEACFNPDGSQIFGYDPKDCEGDVPYRTIVTLIGMIVHLIVAYTAHHLFTTEKLPLKYDIFRSYKKVGNTIIPTRTRYLHEEFQMSEYEKEQVKGSRGMSNAGYS